MVTSSSSLSCTTQTNKTAPLATLTYFTPMPNTQQTILPKKQQVKKFKTSPKKTASIIKDLNNNSDCLKDMNNNLNEEKHCAQLNLKNKIVLY
jgi:hypothetical protein